MAADQPPPERDPDGERPAVCEYMQPPAGGVGVQLRHLRIYGLGDGARQTAERRAAIRYQAAQKRGSRSDVHPPKRRPECLRRKIPVDIAETACVGRLFHCVIPPDFRRAPP